MTIKCTLCDLSITTPTTISDDLPFCCHGCKAVYTILSSKNTLQNPRENPLFLQALDAGIISNPELLKEIAQNKSGNLNPTSVQRWYFEIGEMWCPTCAELIRWILLKEKGVLNCVIDYASDIASLEFNSMATSKDTLTKLIQQWGYSVLPLDESQSKPVPLSLYLRLAIASFCSLNVMMLAYPLYATFFDSSEEGVGNLFAWISLYASLPVLTYSAWPIFQKFWNSIKAGLFGMEALVTIGVLAATSLSIHELAQGSNRVYFDSMTVIVAFVLFGRVLEARAKFSAKQAFLSLTRALPRKGRKKFGENDFRFVSVKEIDVGDLLVAFSGEKIVLDGVVCAGVGFCDQSVMTGEPEPVRKAEGDTVSAGTVLQEGELHYRVNAPPEKSLLSRIVEMTHGELGKKQPYIRPADKIVQWFIPFIFTIALLTGALCYFFQVNDGQGVTNTAILRMTAILLISCPCAIGIAAPLAEGYLLSALARQGVIVRNRGVLSLLGKETCYVYDKTGTVTEGKFKVLQGLEHLSNYDLSVLKSLTAHSNHLISRAIHESIPQIAIEGLLSIERISKGMIGTLGDSTYLLGSLSFMLENRVDISSNPQDRLKQSTSCFFAHQQTILAEIVLGDQIRKEVPAALAEMKDVKTILLSGDRESSVAEIAQTCGFSEAVWEQTPSQKMEYIQQMIATGNTVAMVGDGINDAPALTAAHVGISVVSASDLSIQVSDILLTSSSLSSIPKMRTLASFSRKIVQQNLFWAFFYNVIGISLAVSGMMSPLYAAAAMVLSSLMVILNSQRISQK